MRALVLVVVVVLAGCYAKVNPRNPSMVAFTEQRVPRPAGVTWEDVSGATMRWLIERDLDSRTMTMDDRAHVVRLDWFPVLDRQGKALSDPEMPWVDQDELLVTIEREHRLLVEWSYTDQSIVIRVDCRERVKGPNFWHVCDPSTIDAQFVDWVRELMARVAVVADDRAKDASWRAH